MVLFKQLQKGVDEAMPNRAKHKKHEGMAVYDQRRAYQDHLFKRALLSNVQVTPCRCLLLIPCFYSFKTKIMYIPKHFSKVHVITKCDSAWP